MLALVRQKQNWANELRLLAILRVNLTCLIEPSILKAAQLLGLRRSARYHRAANFDRLVVICKQFIKFDFWTTTPHLMPPPIPSPTHTHTHIIHYCVWAISTDCHLRVCAGPNNTSAKGKLPALEMPDVVSLQFLKSVLCGSNVLSSRWRWNRNNCEAIKLINGTQAIIYILYLI